MDITVYKRVTDVQATWRSHGWSPPSEDPDVKAKWLFYRTLDTGGSNESMPELQRLEEQGQGVQTRHSVRMEMETPGLSQLRT